MSIGYRTQLSNKKGKLYIDGLSTEALARRFGTPLYVYSAARIRANATRLIKALQTEDQRIHIAYSLKANPNPGLLAVVNIELEQSGIIHTRALVWRTESSGRPLTPTASDTGIELRLLYST